MSILRFRPAATLFAVVLALSAFLVPSVSPALASGDCEAWDGSTYHSVVSSDVLHTHTGSYAIGGATEEFAIRFKALGTSPYFNGWEYNAYAAQSASFYILKWVNPTVSYAADGIDLNEGVSLTSGLNAISPDNGTDNLTSGDEYLAVVDIYNTWNTIWINAPILYPNTIHNMSAVSGDTYYYHAGQGLTNATWTNADPSAADNWLLTPDVCT